MSRPVDVLLVDGTLATRRMLGEILLADANVRLAGSVSGGAAALKFLGEHAADIVVMDTHMKGMDGYEVTRQIMETHPLPIVLCSAPSDPGDVATTFRALEAGAVALVAKPAPGSPEFDKQAAELRKMVRLMAEVKVVRRWPKKPAADRTPPAPPVRAAGMVGMGASTGGPPALQTILAGLPKDFALPILVVQHISHGFLPGLAEWLGQTTALQVQIAANGIEPKPGHVYLAPDDFHMEVDVAGRIRLTREPPDNSLRPSVNRLFRSLAAHCGHRSVGVLLTGMGRDGARELRAMRETGAHTIAQDRASSVVHGMPGAAVSLDAASEVLPLDRIADALCRIVHPNRIEHSP